MDITLIAKHQSGSSSMLQQIPSKPTDFPGNNAGAVQVHVTSANKDTIGSYHVRGEITNNGKYYIEFRQGNSLLVFVLTA